MRLARRGYRTELIETTTLEEANARLIPWIRQRARWNKGYALTWAVHMRSPAALWRDLGPRGFFGAQVLLLGTLSQAALAPVFWVFLLAAFGVIAHPLSGGALALRALGGDGADGGQRGGDPGPVLDGGAAGAGLARLAAA